MAQSILKILAVFIIGISGGIFADQILWPYFIERPLFQQYRLEQSPTYVTEKQETTLYVQENTAMRKSVEDVLPAVVGVKTKTVAGETLLGSGIVVTSDGLIVTLATLVPKGSDFAFFVDEKWPAFQILKRDLENNLALVKVDIKGLKTRGFADITKMKLAEPVFLVGVTFPQNMVNSGIIASFNGDSVQTNIFEKQIMAGSPLFDVEGKLVGLSVVAEDGRVSAVPANLIRAFIGL